MRPGQQNENCSTKTNNVKPQNMIQKPYGYLSTCLIFSKDRKQHWDNTVTPGEELSVNTDRFLRNFGPIHTDGRRPEVCID